MVLNYYAFPHNFIEKVLLKQRLSGGIITEISEN